MKEKNWTPENHGKMVADNVMEQSFRNAVEDELVIIGILNDSHKDPRKAVADIIKWHMQVMADPSVSALAREAELWREHVQTQQSTVSRTK